MKWYLEALKKFLDIKGRARRSEFWWFTVINALLGTVVAQFLDNALGTSFITPVFSYVILFASFAVAVRRLHDTGRSGLWYLLVIVPVLGWLVLFFFWIGDSQSGANEYGPNPKGA
jgi:uncharacterized membrane protein YhaH (DUF805 family)